MSRLWNAVSWRKPRTGMLKTALSFEIDCIKTKIRMRSAPTPMMPRSGESLTSVFPPTIPRSIKIMMMTTMRSAICGSALLMTSTTSTLLYCPVTWGMMTRRAIVSDMIMLYLRPPSAGKRLTFSRTAKSRVKMRRKGRMTSRRPTESK